MHCSSDTSYCIYWCYNNHIMIFNSGRVLISFLYLLYILELNVTGICDHQRPLFLHNKIG